MRPEEEWDGAILRELSPEWAERVIFLEECGSTNDEARRLGQKGVGDRAVILTERQTAGRGRRGQAWACPPGEGLAFSLIVRPSEVAGLWSRAALAAGLAVAEALEGFGVAAGMKWPNDVWVGGRKISGILVEAEVEAGFLVVGVGVNINVSDFPSDLAHPATSLLLEGGARVSREEVLISCLGRLDLRLAQISEGFHDLLARWSDRCVLTGREVRLEAGGVTKCGTVEGVSPRGELLLRTATGLEVISQASEIRLR